MAILRKSTFAEMTRQLSVMVRLKMPLSESLMTLALTCPSASLRKALLKAGKDVQSGSPLSESAADNPKVFPKYWRSLVSLGEKSGQLDKFLSLASEMSKDIAVVQNRVLKALIYPSLVLLALLADLVVLAFIVGPLTFEITKSFGIEIHYLVPEDQLTPLTSFFLSVPQLFHWVLLMLFVMTLCFVLRNGWGRGTRFEDRLLLNFPLWGQVVRKANASILSRCLDLLLNAGVPLPDALELCAEVTPNRAVKDSVLLARDHVSSGDSLAEGLDVYPVFSEPFLWAIHGMEKQGSLPDGLKHLAKQMEFQTDVSLRIWIDTLNPVLLFVLSVSVCFFLTFPMGHVVRILNAIM